jgi:hypothetical protein
MATDWTRDPLWDVAYVGKERLPGVARVDIKLPGGLDVRKPKGARGAIVRDTGAQAARVSIELTMMPADMPELERVIPLLRGRGAGASASILDFSHPLAKLWGVGKIVVDDISTPSPTAGGAFRMSISAFEHVPAPKAVKKPKEEDASGWNDVQGLKDALSERPSQSGAAEENFTSDDPIQGSGF